VSSAAQIALVAVATGAACSLAGVFLVLRRMAMMADAISHSILPGLVAGYFLAKGPNLLAGFVGATAAGLLTVWAVDALARTRRVSEDSAIGLVFTAMFALGVLVVSKFMANVHIDTDAVLFGEIAFVPFDTWSLGGRPMGPVALWTLGGLTLANSAFLVLCFKELKLTTFDPTLAATIGLAPGVMHFWLMTSVAVTTVGAFSAVGAILSVAMVVAPPVTASLLTRRLPSLIGLSLGIGAGCALVGYGLAAALDVSISGMVATTLGAAFVATLAFAPERGVLARARQRREHAARFAAEMLVVHLSAHEGSAAEATESDAAHLEAELRWSRETAERTVRRAVAEGWVEAKGGRLSLTDAGRAAARVAQAR
jgi:manganese/zinc/iron transport system permease protein